MEVKPIPAALLCDSVTLILPSEDGEEQTELCGVRVIPRQSAERRSDRGIHVSSFVTVYYDCENSSPAGVEPVCGQWLLFGEKRYEITKVEEFGLSRRHHLRITAECRLI